jgi:hypothetical protein
MPGIDTYTKLMLHCDGANGSTVFTDSSGTGKTISRGGSNVLVQTDASKFGGASGRFPQTGYLTSPNHADWDWGTGAFTIDFWIRPGVLSGDQNVMHRWQASQMIGTFWIYLPSGSTLRFYAASQGGSWDMVNSLTMGTLTVNTWSHIAVVRSGNTFYTFNNGVQQGTATSSLAVQATGTALWIGARESPSVGNYLNAWLDEIRISKGIARWTSNFTPPALPYSADYLKTGIVIASDSIASGVDNEERQKTSLVTSNNSIASGTSAEERPRSGIAASNSIVSGIDNEVLARAGLTIVGNSIASGIRARERLRTGLAKLDLVKLSGVDQYTATETARVILDQIVSGTEIATLNRKNIAISDRILNGGVQKALNRKNLVISDRILSGADVAIHSRQNIIVSSNSILTGADASTFVRKNVVISPSVLSGVDQSTFVRKNIAISEGIAGGVGIWVSVETGTVVIDRVTTGWKQRFTPRTGIAVVSHMALTGHEIGILHRPGTAIIRPVPIGRWAYVSLSHVGHAQSTLQAFGTEVGIFSEAGKVFSDRIAIGKSVAIFPNVGIVISPAVARGVKQRFITKKVYADWRGLLRGVDSAQFTEHGTVNGTWLSRLSDQRTRLRKGFAVSALAMTGMGSGIHPKTGRVVIQNSRVSGVKLRIVPRTGKAVVTVSFRGSRHHTAARAGTVVLKPLPGGNFAIDFSDNPNYFERTLLEVILEAPELISAEGVPEPTLTAAISSPRLTSAQR